MPGQDKHIYTSEDISRYHSGAMSQAEMHAMEKAALEDPFLADALEGFVYSRDMNAELASLRNRLQEKTDTKVVAMPVRRKNYGWMRIAALFVVFAAAGWVIFMMNTRGENDLAVQKAPVEKMADKKEADFTDRNKSSFDTTTSDTYVPAPEDETVAAASPNQWNNSVYKNKPIVIPPSSDEDLAVTTDYYQTTESDSVATITSNAVAATETIVSPKAQQNNYSFSAPRMNTINGFVTDERNNAIPFASVIARNNRGTLTDNDGRFQLNVPDTVSVVDVNAPGYESRNINLKEDKERSQIVLKENTDKLDEVVLAQNKRADVASRKQPQTITEIGELEPEGGWSEYNSYLAEKLNPPNNYRKKTPSGVVELSFDVDAEGNPVNITVEKSLCASCDKEAIRLLKEGPKWKKQEGKGKITIRF